MSGIEQAELLSIWLLVALFLGFLLSRKNASLAKLFLLSASARIVVAVLQSGYGMFLANQDAVVYAKQGSLLASDSRSYVLGDVSSSQRGIIGTNAWVSTFVGPIPTTVMVAILSSLISALAVVLALAPFFGGADGTPHYSGHRRLLFYGAVFSPSFLFWGSQDLKEPFVMLGVALFVYGFYVGWPSKAILGPTGILVCIAYRPYIGALVLGVGGLFALARPARRRAPRATLALLLITALLVGIKFGSGITGVELSQQEEYSQLAGGNSVSASVGGRTGWLANVGEIFFAPLPWQTPDNIVSFFAYIESMIIGVLIIRYLFRLLTRRRELVCEGALIAVLLYFTSASIYAFGLANSGTLSRERSPFLLVLLPLLILPSGGRHLGTSGSGWPRDDVDRRRPSPDIPHSPATTSI